MEETRKWIEGITAIFGLVALAIWLWKGEFNKQPPIPPNTPIGQIETKLNVGWTAINDDEVEVPPNPLAPQGTTVNLRKVANDNNLRTEQDVKDFDAKAQKVLSDCTNAVLSEGEANPIAMREKRVDCLRKNYSDNDIGYIGGKIAI